MSSSLLKNTLLKGDLPGKAESASNLSEKACQSVSSLSGRSQPKYWTFYRVSGKTREAKSLQFPVRTGKLIFMRLNSLDTYDVYCVARTDNETANQFKSIMISNTDNPFWNENFTLDSRVIFKALKFTVWMAYKSSTGEVLNIPIGKVRLRYI